MTDTLPLSTFQKVETHPVSARPQRRGASRRASAPDVPLDDALLAWAKPIAPVEDLDAVARKYPNRKLTLHSERRPLEFYARPGEPNAFSMDSLEFFFLIAQYSEKLSLYG
ncbi:hypothetical protein [Streptomyces sp. NPDC001480]|uniref:hypothetical protein n=1 Tax=Streptomyces sp. NPDC001480 TaxID=3364577 RepID=UPI0036BCE16F